MTNKEWKEMIIKTAQMNREIREAVRRRYLLPPVHEDMPIDSAIEIRMQLEDDNRWHNPHVDVYIAYLGAFGSNLHGAHPSPKKMSDCLPHELEALAKAKREVHLWTFHERDELPTAKELGLVDATHPPTTSEPA